MTTTRILVVEDEGIIAEDLQTSLEDLGYEVTGMATTGEDAVTLAVETKPDLVLMDIILRGEMDGIDAAGRIRASLDCPVVYLTAHADHATIERAKNTQPFGYLIKPIQDRELYTTVEMALFKHRMDRRLRQSEAWLSVTLGSIADGVIATDEEGLVKFMNSAAESITGWKEAEARGRPLNEVFCVSDLERPVLPSALPKRTVDGNDSHAVREILLSLRTRDGKSLVVSAGTSSISDGCGAVFGTVVVFRDVTERCKAEEHLHLLSTALEQTLDGVAVSDMDGNLLYINRAWADIHGYETDELVGKHLSIFHTEEQLAQVNEAMEILWETGGFSGELWHVRRNGEEFPTLMHNSFLRDADGNRVGMIGTLRDITNLKRAAEELRKSHEQLEAYSNSLEQKVEERTADLEASRRELKRYSESLEKTNEALKIIIQGIEEQKKEVEKKISHNLNLTVKPIIDQLKAQEAPDTVRFLVKSLEFNVSNLFTSFGLKLIKDGHRLTPKEVRVCEMIRSGLSSKQIAKVMGISTQTVLVHRKNIRKKLGLARSKRNLASYLKTSL